MTGGPLSFLYTQGMPWWHSARCNSFAHRRDVRTDEPPQTCNRSKFLRCPFPHHFCDASSDQTTQGPGSATRARFGLIPAGQDNTHHRMAGGRRHWPPDRNRTITGAPPGLCLIAVKPGPPNQHDPSNGGWPLDRNRTIKRSVDRTARFGRGQDASKDWLDCGARPAPVKAMPSENTRPL